MSPQPICYGWYPPHITVVDNTGEARGTSSAINGNDGVFVPPLYAYIYGFTYTAWKVSKYEVLSSPYFPAFGLNTGKYGPENTPYLDTFHTVLSFFKFKFAKNLEKKKKAKSRYFDIIANFEY